MNLQKQLENLKKSAEESAEIVEKARKSEAIFSQRFREAQEFLESKKFAEVVVKELFTGAQFSETDEFEEAKKKIGILLKMESEEEEEIKQMGGSKKDQTAQLTFNVKSSLGLAIQGLVRKVEREKKEHEMKQRQAQKEKEMQELTNSTMRNQPQGFSAQISTEMFRRLGRLQHSGVTEDLT